MINEMDVLDTICFLALDGVDSILVKESDVIYSKHGLVNIISSQYSGDLRKVLTDIDGRLDGYSQSMIGADIAFYKNSFPVMSEVFLGDFERFVRTSLFGPGIYVVSHSVGFNAFPINLELSKMSPMEINIRNGRLFFSGEITSSCWIEEYVIDRRVGAVILNGVLSVDECLLCCRLVDLGVSVFMITPSLSSSHVIMDLKKFIGVEKLIDVLRSALTVIQIPDSSSRLNPRICFEDSDGFGYWSSNQFSPSGEHLVVSYGGVGTINSSNLSSDFIEVNKSVKKALLVSSSVGELNAELKMSAGWVSVSDNAMLMAKSNCVSMADLDKFVGRF